MNEEEEVEKIKSVGQFIKNKIILKGMKKIIIIIAIVIAVIIIFACTRLINIKENANYNSKKKGNVPYNFQNYSSNISYSNGIMQAGKTAKDLWDEILDNDGNITNYLDGPEELKKLMNAQFVTQFMDTRLDTTEARSEKEWEDINKDVEKNEINGVVKLKRANSDGSEMQMHYVSEEDYNELINKYNETGSEEDKKNALRVFTIGTSNSSSFSLNSGTVSNTGDLPNEADGKFYTDADGNQVIELPTGEGPGYRYGGIGDYFKYEGWQNMQTWQNPGYRNAAQGPFTQKAKEQYGEAGLFDSEGFGIVDGRYVIACSTLFGKTGDYIDFYQSDGTIFHCIIGDAKGNQAGNLNPWGHVSGEGENAYINVVEFLVNCEAKYGPVWSEYSGPGDEINPLTGQKYDTYTKNVHANPGDYGLLNGIDGQPFHTEWGKKYIAKAVNLRK